MHYARDFHLRQSSIQRLLLLLALLAAFALRLYHLGAESLWYDETVSVALARQSIPALIAHTAGDIHPPGYYLLLHLWQGLTHPTLAHGLEFLFAWPSLFCGVLIVALLFALGRRCYGSQVALLAGWLAVLNPFHIWYSQEVRMYTLGALLGLFCLWALLQLFTAASKPVARNRGRLRWTLLYAVAAAAGLYTLYYFIFLLLALNALALLLWRVHSKQRGHNDWSVAGQWLGAQLAALLLWAPWLPIFWRQATIPPVPPWRNPWLDWRAVLASINESASALLAGQSAPAPLATLWSLALLALCAIGLFGYTNKSTASRRSATKAAKLSPRLATAVIALYVLLPIVTIDLVTLWVTPLYHVRYLFTYAPPLLLLVAIALMRLAQGRKSLSNGILTGLLLLNCWSLARFWFNPDFQTDQHRAAVTQLAQAWRPGDVILVNAGWVYTAIESYWPTELDGVDAAVPAPLAATLRLPDYANAVSTQSMPATAQRAAAPQLVRTGSVDGAPTLGWGDPTSDFFAISAFQTTQDLQELASHSARIWHYRLYDTVNDPTGLVRQWLAAHTRPLVDTAITGRDYLRLQLFATTGFTTTYASTFAYTFSDASPDRRFGAALQLTALDDAPTAAGSYLYVQSRWQALSEVNTLPATTSFSLRLYNDSGALFAQSDMTPDHPVQGWPPGSLQSLTWALPIPVATPPGQYELVLIAYDQATGEPLALAATKPLMYQMALGQVQVTPALQTPTILTTQAHFDYIDLVRAQILQPQLALLQPLEVELVWRPRPNAYRDTYVAEVSMKNGAGDLVQQWRAALGGWEYPSGEWPPLLPVREVRRLPLDPTTQSGDYTLTLQVLRNDDNKIIPAHQGWWPFGQDTLILGKVKIR
ncbi:MAG: glycosyltransferase family 39 protein [Caldilineaceae bacterium]